MLNSANRQPLASLTGMALRNAILVMLLDGEASGYDLAKAFDASVANFWTAVPQQLYRELEKMEVDGLLSARVIQQRRRPNKRLFALTDAGRAAILGFSRRTPKPTAVRDELLVQVQAVEDGDATAIVAAIRQRLAAATERRDGYERLLARLLAGRTESDFLASAERIGPLLTLRRGIAFEEENIRWGTWAVDVLEARRT